MPAAPWPTDEDERLRALRDSGLLETGSDIRLDNIVNRAAILFNVPLAAIGLIDETKQVYKSSIGLGMPYAPRDLTFCGYTILGTEPLVVPDARLDDRFLDNAMVRGLPGIRFYIGAAVYGPRHQPLGALCVMDTRPGPAITPALLAKFQALADEVTAVFEHPPEVDLKKERLW